MRGFRILKLLVYLEIIAILLSTSGKVKQANHPEKRMFLVESSGRFWWIGDDGRIVGTASPEDSGSTAVVSCVDIRGLKISREDFAILRDLKGVLKSPDVSEICIDEKYIIFRKGVVVYFHKWKDLVENIDGIVGYLPYLVPRSVLELFSGGDLLVLRGGWRWQDTRYTHQ